MISLLPDFIRKPLEIIGDFFSSIILSLVFVIFVCPLSVLYSFESKFKKEKLDGWRPVTGMQIEGEKTEGEKIEGEMKK